MKSTNITFVGCGNMGQSLIGGLIANGHDPAAIRCADPDRLKRDAVLAKFGVEADEDNADAVGRAEVVVLAVKPRYCWPPFPAWPLL